MPMPPRNDKTPHTPHGEAQQQALVLAAFDLIAEGGFEHLRTRDVAARAGVNIATLHYYFATKEDLIRGVVEHLQAEFASQLPQYGVTLAIGPREELHQELADLRVPLAQMPPKLGRMYQVLFELSLRSMRDPSIRAILQDMDANWRAHITEYLREGLQQGIFHSDLAPEVLAVLLIAVIKGTLLEMILTPDAAPTEQIMQAIERWLTNPPQTDR